jgi:hypothetical protein
MMTPASESILNQALEDHQARPAQPRRRLYPVNQFCERNPAWTPGAIRNLIFYAEPRHSSRGVILGNGLKEAGAIVRLGRKVLLDEERFFVWVDSQQQHRQLELPLTVED